MLYIDENAKSSFDNKANELLTLVEEAQLKQRIETFAPEVHIKHHITEKDIIKFYPEILTNAFGEEQGFSFIHERKNYGIFGDKYKHLLRLAESIAKIPSIRETISQKTIKNLIHEWITKKYIKTIDKGISDYVIEESKSKIVSQDVWIPIRFLQIEIPFIVGKIAFKPITKAMIDGLEKSCVNDSPDNESKIKELFDKGIRKFQGFAAATMTIEGDPERAEEIGLEEAGKSLLMLRIFSIAAFHPKITSIYNIWGSEKVDRVSILLLREGKFNSITDQSLGKVFPFERMDQKRIERHMGEGLNILSNLLVNEDKTPFQKNALDAIFIFARCATAKDPADKLVYILVSLESMFLRNNTEPVQQNLAERISFLIENSIEGRREVIKDVKNGYSFRSSFLHHGASIEDYEALEKFMWQAWRAVTAIISATNNFKTKEEFLNYLDDKKLA